MKVINTSVLEANARRRNVRVLSKAEPDVQVAICRNTLVYLEKYLDTGDLRRLNSNSLGLILEDIRTIIDRFRELKSKLDVGTYGSIDGILEKLRDARDKLWVAIGMFDDSDQLIESKSTQFFAKLRESRESLEAGLKVFKVPNEKG